MAKKKKVEVELVFDSKGSLSAIKTVDGQIHRLKKTTDKTDKSTRKLSNSIKLGLVAALVGAAAAARKGIDVMSESAQLAETQNIAERKLAASLRNVGDASQEKQQMLKKLAAEVQTYSNFGDEAIITAQAMLGTFALSADEIALLTPRLADMAAGVAKTTGETVDLNQVAQALGKATVEGASALKRYGITLTDVQESGLKAATGMEKVRLVGEIIDQNFKGMARATQNARTQMDNAIGDLKESLGKELAPEISDLQRRVTDFVTDERTVEMAEKIGAFVVDMGKGIVRFFQFSVPIAFNKSKALLAGFAETVLEKVGNVIGVLQDPFASISGRVTTNPYQHLINSLGDVEEQARKTVDALFNQEIQQSANLLLAKMQEEQNQKLADSVKAVNQAEQSTSGEDKLTRLQKERDELIKTGVVTERLILLNTQIAQIESERKFVAEASKIQRVEGAKAEVGANEELVASWERTRDAKLKTAQQEIAADKARLDAKQLLIQAEKDYAEQQLSSANTSIQTGKDLARASVDAARQAIQAQIAKLVASSLPPIPFPANLVVWPVAGAATNLLLNKLIPQFADGVTNFGGGMALVGERGPELVTLPQGSNVITNENTDKLIDAISGNRSQGTDMSMLVRELQAVRDSNEALMNEIAGRPVIAHMDTNQAKDALNRHERRQSLIGNNS